MGFGMLMARSNWDVEWETVLEHVSVKWNRRGRRTRPASSPVCGGEGRHRDRGPVVGVLSELWRCPPAALWRRERTFVWRRRPPGWQRDRDCDRYFLAAVWRKSLRPHRSRPRR